MKVLGISCFFHDSAAALVGDGRVLAAVQEERLSRERGAAQFPLRAINSCLQQAGVTVDEVDHVVFHEKPFLKFLRVVQSHVRAWPFSLRQVLETFPSWLEDRLVPGHVLERETGHPCKPLFLKHHYSHGATAFLLSPFEEAAILTVDGVGEMATTTWGHGRGTTLHVENEIHFPHSLGLAYSAVTEYLGFEHHRGEDAVEALAARGVPSALETLRKWIRSLEDGSYQVDRRHFSFTAGRELFTREFVRELGPPRKPGDSLEPRHLDLAASMQALLEEAMLALARHVRHSTGLDRLCIAGGVAQNAACCARIGEEAGFHEVFVPPAPGNDGSALGAALAVSCSLGGPRPAALSAVDLGPALSAAHARRTLVNSRLPFSEKEGAERAAYCARRIRDEGPVAWVQGRLEFSHRPTGSRAILIDPRLDGGLSGVAGRLGMVEPLECAGLLVTDEGAPALIDGEGASPFQTTAPSIRPQSRETVAGALRPDGRAPVQVGCRAAAPALWEILDAYGTLSGLPALAVLPLRLRDEPLANSPEDAIRVARTAGARTLVMDSLVADLSSSPSSGE